MPPHAASFGRRVTGDVSSCRISARQVDVGAVDSTA